MNDDIFFVIFLSVSIFMIVFFISIDIIRIRYQKNKMIPLKNSFGARLKRGFTKITSNMEKDDLNVFSKIYNSEQISKSEEHIVNETILNAETFVAKELKANTVVFDHFEPNPFFDREYICINSKYEYNQVAKHTYPPGNQVAKHTYPPGNQVEKVAKHTYASRSKCPEWGTWSPRLGYAHIDYCLALCIDECQKIEIMYSHFRDRNVQNIKSKKKKTLIMNPGDMFIFSAGPENLISFQNDSSEKGKFILFYFRSSPLEPEIPYLSYLQRKRFLALNRRK